MSDTNAGDATDVDDGTADAGGDAPDTGGDAPDTGGDATVVDGDDATDALSRRAAAQSDRLDSEQRQGTPYTESQVIMPTVKIVAPFAFTYGLFITFHGGGSPGGGFQGGAIMAAVVFMIAFAFGIEATRDWLANTVVVALAVGGALVFAGIGLVPVALGGAFLQYDLLPIPILDPVKYGMEAVEILGIAPIVSGVLMGLFFLLANGFASDGNGFEDDDLDDPNSEGGATADDAVTDGGRTADDATVDGSRATDDTTADGGDR